MLVSNTIFNVISFKTYQNKIIMYYHIKLVYAISPLCVLSFFLYVLHFHRTSNFCSLSSWFKKKNNNIIIMFALPLLTFTIHVPTNWYVSRYFVLFLLLLMLAAVCLVNQQFSSSFSFSISIFQSCIQCGIAFLYITGGKKMKMTWFVN